MIPLLCFIGAIGLVGVNGQLKNATTNPFTYSVGDYFYAGSSEYSPLNYSNTTFQYGYLGKAVGPTILNDNVQPDTSGYMSISLYLENCSIKGQVLSVTKITFNPVVVGKDVVNLTGSIAVKGEERQWKKNWTLAPELTFELSNETFAKSKFPPALQVSFNYKYLKDGKISNFPPVDNVVGSSISNVEFNLKNLNVDSKCITPKPDPKPKPKPAPKPKKAAENLFAVIAAPPATAITTPDGYGNVVVLPNDASVPFDNFGISGLNASVWLGVQQGTPGFNDTNTWNQWIKDIKPKGLFFNVQQGTDYGDQLPDLLKKFDGKQPTIVNYFSLDGNFSSMKKVSTLPNVLLSAPLYNYEIDNVTDLRTLLSSNGFSDEDILCKFIPLSKKPFTKAIADFRYAGLGPYADPSAAQALLNGTLPSKTNCKA